MSKDWEEKKTIFEVVLTYRIEEKDATTALDEVLAKHPLKSVSLSCVPVETNEELED